MSSSIDGAVYGALVADAFSLGAYWEYDVDEIKKAFPVYKDLYDPISEYHNGKKAGDFTHYGDQTMWLLESLALEKEFSLFSFAKRWKKYMSEYNDYIDGASKKTLENLKSEKSALQSGSFSQDLSVVGRIAPLALLYHDKQKDFENVAILQTKFTHSSPSALEATRFFSKLLYLIFQGFSPTNSILKVQGETEDEKMQHWIKIALASTDHDTSEAVKSFGQSCSVNGAFASTLHLILKYEDSYEKAMIENVYAGGDSAARGMVTGMIIGAYKGVGVIPKSWIEELSSKSRIEKYLGMIRG